MIEVNSIRTRMQLILVIFWMGLLCLRSPCCLLAGGKASLSTCTHTACVYKICLGCTWNAKWTRCLLSTQSCQNNDLNQKQDRAPLDAYGTAQTRYHMTKTSPVRFDSTRRGDAGICKQHRSRELLYITPIR